jgi:aldose 1-epimerase
MTVHGTVLTLRAGGYTAEVAQVGATLLSLTHRHHRLLDPVVPGELDSAWRGRTLVPWPNRIVQGRYEVGGTAYHLPVNEPETGAALHGLAAFQRWDLTASTADLAAWELELPASYGYPFQVRCTTTYALDGDGGLSITVQGTNTGPQPAPFGASTHPYLTCDGRPLDECRVSLPAGSVLLTDARSSPTEVVSAAEVGIDPTGPTPLRGLSVDHAFTDLPTPWAAELRHPDITGVRVDSDAPWVQLYTGERIGRLAAGVEPMTCPPDAFNRDPERVLLEPGATRTLTLRISALPPTG